MGREEWVRGGKTHSLWLNHHSQCEGKRDVTYWQKYPCYPLKPPWLSRLSRASFLCSPLFLHLNMLHRKDICLRCGQVHFYHLPVQCLSEFRRLKFTTIYSNTRKLKSSKTREAKTYFPHGHLVPHLLFLFTQWT